MLSIETSPPPPPPPPPDLPICQLNTINDDVVDDNNKSSCRFDHDQRPPSSSSSLNTVVKDKLPLLDPPPTNPNFSIRDYVFTSRSKDIKNNWPFSLKNLQLCFKHGVKNVLPPFQPLETVRTNSFNSCSFHDQKNQQALLSESDNKEPVKPSNLLGDSQGQLNDKLVQDISSCRSGDENNDFPSTTTSLSQSEIKSVHKKNRQSKHPSRSFKIVLKRSAEVGALGAPMTNKTESTSPPLGKKCRLMVKLGGIADRSSTEDIASNCTSVSETMGSKICPVCKTFSSSSNTTLNAHIDQCLSVEPTPKWSLDSKLTRYRIKPRKVKLMVDIYKTAPYCTLEELERRNGRSWAVAPGMPDSMEIEKIETSNEEKYQRATPVNSKGADDVGPVYIDESGNKIRILSKITNSHLSNEGVVDVGSRKCLKGVKGSKFISKKKKKGLHQKPPKYLKLDSQYNTTMFNKNHSYQASGGRNTGMSKTCHKEAQMLKHIKSSGSGALRPWVRSKRRGFKKRSNQEDQQTVRHMPQCNLVEDNCSFPNGDMAGGVCQKKFAVPSENASSSQRKNEMLKKSIKKAKILRESCERNEANNFLGTQTSRKLDRSCTPVKQTANESSKDGSSSNGDGCMSTRSFNSTWNHASSLHKEAVDSQNHGIKSSNVSSSTSMKSTQHSDTILTKSMRLYSFGKKGSSLSCQLSGNGSRPCKIKKLSSLKRSQLHCMTQRDEEEIVDWDSKAEQKYSLTDDDTEEQFEKEKVSVDEAHGEDLDGNELSESSRDDLPQVCGDAIAEEEPSSESLGTDEVTASSESDDLEIYKTGCSFNTQSNPPHSVEECGGLACGNEASREVDNDFLCEQDMFCVDMRVEYDAEAGQGDSYAMLDPILIPGPPGSFLPSPRDMGSEDFQGTSSLTTSRVLSSDQRDVIDVDSSDSPLSAVSTFSNSAAEGSAFKDLEQRSASHGEGKNTLGVVVASIQNQVQNIGAYPLETTNKGLERGYFDGEYVKLNRFAIEKGSLGLKIDQPCRCQRKEKFSHVVPLNLQESPQISRRQKMGSTTVSPAISGQISLKQVPPVASCPPSGAEKVSVLLASADPLNDPIPQKSSSSAAVKICPHSDCDLVSPSSSSVLRLMGKNLMVVNKDNDAPMQPATIWEQTTQFPPFPSISSKNVENQNSFHPMASQSTKTLGWDSCCNISQGFDVRLPSSFRRFSGDSSSSQTSTQLPTVFLGEQQANGCNSNYYYPSQFNMPESSDLYSPIPASFHGEKVVSEYSYKYSGSSTSNQPEKEVIVIDDTPDEHNNGGQVFSYPTVAKDGLNYGHPLPRYHPIECSLLGESPMVHNARFLASTSSNQVKRGCTPEGSVIPQRSLSTAASPPTTGPIRSAAIYYFPSLS